MDYFKTLYVLHTIKPYEESKAPYTIYMSNFRLMTVLMIH